MRILWSHPAVAKIFKSPRIAQSEMPPLLTEFFETTEKLASLTLLLCWMSKTTTSVPVDVQIPLLILFEYWNDKTKPKKQKKMSKKCGFFSRKIWIHLVRSGASASNILKKDSSNPKCKWFRFHNHFQRINSAPRFLLVVPPTDLYSCTFLVGMRYVQMWILLNLKIKPFPKGIRLYRKTRSLVKVWWKRYLIFAFPLDWNMVWVGKLVLLLECSKFLLICWSLLKIQEKFLLERLRRNS